MARQKMSMMDKLKNQLSRQGWVWDFEEENSLDLCGYRVEIEDGRYNIYNGEEFYSVVDPRSIINWVHKKTN